jgi:hypothetical protein
MRRAARVARLTAGALLLLAASRFIFGTFTWLFAEYSRHAAQPQIYLSPWDDIARLSVISLGSIPLVLFCGVRLMRSKAEAAAYLPSSLAFAADCAGFYCAATFVQFLLPPMASPSTPLLDNMRDALGISANRGSIRRIQRARCFGLVTASCDAAARIRISMRVRCPDNHCLRLGLGVFQAEQS